MMMVIADTSMRNDLERVKKQFSDFFFRTNYVSSDVVVSPLWLIIIAYIMGWRPSKNYPSTFLHK